MKRYEKYKDSGIEWIGEVPEGWSLIDLKYLGDINKTLINPKDIGNKLVHDYSMPAFDAGCNPFLLLGNELESTKICITNSCLLINKLNVFKQRIWLVSNPEADSVASTEFVPIHITKADDRFILYYLLNKCLTDYLCNISFGSTNSQRRVSPETIHKIKVALPSKEEQRGIVEYLDYKVGKIDKAVEGINAQIEDLKGYRQSVISEAVTKGINRNVKMKDSGVEWIGEVPEGWDTKLIKFMFSFGRGLNITKADLAKSGTPVISYGQIHSPLNTGTTVDDALLRFVPRVIAYNRSECKVKTGDFIFADTSEDRAGCGNCVYIDREGIYAGYHSLVLDGKGRNNKYFAYLFKSDEWRTQIRARVSGVKVYSITQKILADCSVLIPSNEEQERIASYLDEKTAKIDGAIKALEMQREDLVALKQSVISEAVTGKVDVRGWNIDNALSRT